MSKVKQIRELVAQAQELQQNSTGDYLAFRTDFIEKVKEIRENRDYSDAGKQKLIDRLKHSKKVEFLQASRSYRKKYDELLSTAKKQALDVIYSKTPKVEDEVLERFKRDFAELKTEIMLSNAKKGKEILEGFLQKINEPGLAEIVKSEFAEVIQPILNGVTDAQESAKYKHELLKAFEETKIRSMDPEALEAMKVAEYADAAINGKFFNLAVENAVGADLDADAKRYIHQPDEYFKINPDDDKPISGTRTIDDIFAEEEAKKL